MSWTRDPSSPEDERFPDGQSETEDATSVTASAMKSKRFITDYCSVCIGCLIKGVHSSFHFLVR